MNAICDDTNRQITALPPADPENQVEFRKNFAEIVRLNRAALEDTRMVDAPAEDSESLTAALQKQERAVTELEQLGAMVERGQATTVEQHRP